MGKYLYTKHSKEKLRLSLKPFAGGGEGNLYKIVSPSKWKNYAAKIYHKSKRSPIREAKLQYMLDNAPASTQFQRGDSDSRLVWVVDLLYDDKNEFWGFLMPLIQGEKLEVLCTPQLPKKINPIWGRFRFSDPEAEGLRLKVCFNLAAAVHQLHATQQYVLVDLKPDNVIIQPNGMLWLVDVDSIEIIKNGQKLYDAPVATPEYTPPEHYRKDLDYDPTSFAEWDQFGLGVIFYKLLFGIHPYAASCLPPYDKANSLAQKIENGLFVYRSDLRDYFHTIPTMHEPFRKLNRKLQALFISCFVDGHQKPTARPRADQWCSVLLQLLDLTVRQAMPSELFKMPVHLSHNMPVLSTPPPDSPKSKLALAKQTWNAFKMDEDKLKIFEGPFSGALGVRIFFLLGIIFLAAGLYFLVAKSNFLFLAIGLVLVVIARYSSGLNLSKQKEYQEKKEVKRLAIQAKKEYEQGRSKVYGIQNYLHEFYMNLQKDHSQLIDYLKRKVDENQHRYKIELDKLYKLLVRKDKDVEVLLEYEKAAYQRLVQKYDNEMRGKSLFYDAVSLDEELSNLQFQQIESIQAAINDDEEKGLIEQQQTIEKELTLLQEKEKEKEKEIRTELAHLKASLDKKQLAELKLQEKRMNKNAGHKMGDVSMHADKYLLSFKEPILEWLAEHEIEQIDEIEKISQKGEVVLKSSEKHSITPLKYYQIHDLVKWWIDLREHEHNIVPANMERMIEEKYYEEYLRQRQKLLLKLETSLEEMQADRKQLYKAYKLSMSQLADKYEEQAQRIKQKYKEGISILEKILERRLNEEQVIHKEYENQYKAIIEECSLLANDVKQKILKLASVKLTEEQQKQYLLLQKNMEVFHAARERLDEEKISLEKLIKTYEQQKEEEATYLYITPSSHFWKMIFA
ncbi:MAG: hypothetical protein GY810_16590 [Aureispira sp.]|nr:hypothetical protein [Aureispira sp.]